MISSLFHKPFVGHQKQWVEFIEILLPIYLMSHKHATSWYIINFTSFISMHLGVPIKSLVLENGLFRSTTQGWDATVSIFQIFGRFVVLHRNYRCILYIQPFHIFVFTFTFYDLRSTTNGDLSLSFVTLVFVSVGPKANDGHYNIKKFSVLF